MSESTELTTAEETDVVTEEGDWSDAAVIDNTGNSKIRDFDAASEDHPLVQYAGEKALRTDTQGGGEFVSEEIYENDAEWVREWLQNAEAACIKRCKMLIELSPEFEDGWLTSSVELEDGKEMEIPRPISEVVEAARSLGYDPTIVWDVFLDEREIVTEDNGIGMPAKVFWEAFKSPFSSGSGVAEDSGGKFGIGSNSVEKVHGPEGAAKVITRSCRPGDHEGFHAYSYRGGATAIDGEIDDDFYGTRFEIPVYEEFDIDKVEEWVETYSEKLRVPVLYREHDAGSTPVEEEHEATDFIESYDDPAVVIDRPGEFTVVAGPDCRENQKYGSPSDPDTYLISMKIDRNTKKSMGTLWEPVVQLHDEQGRIVAGPNRGNYAHHSKVYETGQNVNQVGELHEEDVVLPVPTGDRGRLKKNDQQYEFFSYINGLVKEEELSKAGEIIEDMKDADNVGNALDSKGDWKLLERMIDKHGSYRVFDSYTNFKGYLNDEPHLPDIPKDTMKEMWRLFEEIEHCEKGAGYSSKSRSRHEERLGLFLTENDSDHVYMAASTGGKFTQRFKVAERTHDDAEVIVVEGASRYEKWDCYFEGKLKDVPVEKSADHNFDVSDHIHQKNQKPDRTIPEKVKDRELKIRTSADNSSIDKRLSIKAMKDRLEVGSSGVPGHDKLVLFPKGADANISDHYDMAKYAAIASVSKAEYDKLADYDDVMTFAEFTDWSRTALIATEDGAMTPKELIEDDRMVILTYRPITNGDYVKLLGDDYEELRSHYCDDRRNQLGWLNILDDYTDSYSSNDSFEDIDESELPDTLFALACSTVLSRAEWAFDQHDFDEKDVAGLKLTNDKFGYRKPVRWGDLDKRTRTYRLMVDTPNWSNDSSVYNMLKGKRRDSMKVQMYLGLHDRGINPAEEDPEDMREMI
jgi:hypothetical protein